MKINQHTELFGIIGRPLQHSLSPAMHNAAFEACNLNAVYLAFETLDPEAALRAVRALNIRGLSVTIPYKSTVIPLLDELDPLAAKIGAVNTIVNRNGRLLGLNTDAGAGLKALENHKITVKEKSCLIIGAGGAARALAWSLKLKGAHITITNRSPAKGETLADELSCAFVPWEKRGAQKFEILVQTTPVGMSPHPDQCPVPEQMLKPGLAVMDIIYNPLETECIRLAKAHGCIPVNGLAMFIQQGAEQFRSWTGLDAPVAVMRKAVLASLQNNSKQSNIIRQD
jgi:shikimate dehydrogenase